MGLGFLTLLVWLAALCAARDLRGPATVDKRSTIDPLLGEIFNDPSATSLTKTTLDDADDLDAVPFSGSASGLDDGSASGDLTDLAESQNTEQQQQQQQQQQQLQETAGSASGDLTDLAESQDTEQQQQQQQQQETTVVTPTYNITETPMNASARKDDTTDTTSDAPSAEPNSAAPATMTTEPLTSPDATASQQDVTSLEEKSDPNSTPSADAVTGKADAGVLPGFDDKQLYDATIVKKNDVPRPQAFVNTTADVPASQRSDVPAAPAVRKSSVAGGPKGSFPLQLHKVSPYMKLIKKTGIAKAAATKKSDIPHRSVVPALPDMPSAPDSQLPAGANGQTADQAQALAPDMAAYPQADQAQGLPADQQFTPQAAGPSDMLAPGTGMQADSQSAMSQLDAAAPAPSVDPNAQAPVPGADPNAQAPAAGVDPYAQAPVPGADPNAQSPYMNQSYPGDQQAYDPSLQQTADQAPAAPQAVPVFQGISPKKPDMEDTCDDMFATCPEMAKNHYCEKYEQLMRIQCRKSCHFCELPNISDSGSGSGSASDEGSSDDQYAYDHYEESGSGQESGSALWDEDMSDQDLYNSYRKKSEIPGEARDAAGKFSGESGSGSGLWDAPSPRDDILAASGSAAASDSSGKQDSTAQNASASEVESGESPPEPQSPSDELFSGSGSLAEDLATGMVSRAEKHSSIPLAPPPVPVRASIYPKIDLKAIARAVDRYRPVALKMLGEALEGAAEEEKEEIVRKSHIPMPPASFYLKKMGFPIDEEDPMRKSFVPNPIGPNFGPVSGPEAMGYPDSEYAPSYGGMVPNGEALSSFYDQQNNVARSDIAKGSEELEETTEDGAAEGAKEESKDEKEEEEAQQEKAKDEKEKSDEKKKKNDKKKESEKLGDKVTAKDKPPEDDPYQFVRHMAPGASMMPIPARPGATLKNVGHSDAIMLWKNRQMPNLNARKKNAIPKPAETASFSPEREPVPGRAGASLASLGQDFRSSIPSQDYATQPEQPTGLTGEEAAPVFPQVHGNDMMLGSETYNGQAEKKGLLAQLTPQKSNTSSSDSRTAIPAQSSSRAPFAGSFPLSLRKIVPGMAQKKDELYKQVKEAISRNSVPSMLPDQATSAFQAQKPPISFFQQQSMLPQAAPAVTRAGLPSDVKAAPGIEQAAASFSDALQGHSIASQLEQEDNSLTGSLNSAITAASPEMSLSSVKAFASPEAEISGKIPAKSSQAADSRAKVSHGSESIGESMNKPPLMPPLVHAFSNSELPPLNHEQEALLPPLNHKEQEAYLPPLNHADNSILPPLNHNEHSFAFLPPLNHEESSVLPPLNHAEQNAYLPPLNHNNLPPLNHQDDAQTSRYTGSFPDVTTLNDQGQGQARSQSPVWPYAPQQAGDQLRSEASLRGNMPMAAPNVDSSIDNDGDSSRRQFPTGGKPYPIPLPPEGDSDDDMNDQSVLDAYGGLNKQPKVLGPIKKKNLIRPKPDLKCGSGWTGALGDFGAFCYRVNFAPRNWSSAHEDCKDAGGEVFSVTNAYEQRFLENFTNVESWLGYRDESRDGTWSWADGSRSVFTNWDSSAKNDHGNGRDCVVLDSKEGKWKDAPCQQKKSYLCKRKVEDCEKGWKKLTLNSVRGCYKLMEDAKKWEDAQLSCLDQKANLASVVSDDEQTMISQVYSKQDMWIGYNDVDSEGNWVWTDSLTSSYTNWDDKSPNNGGLSCAIVTTTGKWHDEPCQSQFSYICKKPSPTSAQHPAKDGSLTDEVNSFIANHPLNPALDDSVTVFGKQSVTPVYFWTLQKIFNRRIHGSNAIAAHGTIKAADGGLQLNGEDAWLDAGDFYGQCLGDPDLCIKGFSFGVQLNFDNDALDYKDKRFVLDSMGESRGAAIFIQNGSLHYQVVTSTKTWKLSTELPVNQWQDVVMTWKREEGLMLYINGAFRDSVKEGTTTDLVPNKQARLTIGRKSGNRPFKYTRMYISSLYAFTRFLSPEDVPYVFTYEDTVVPRYLWLLPQLVGGAVPGSPDISVSGAVKAVDGGLKFGGDDTFLTVGNFDNKCLHDPALCPKGLSLSFKVKFDKVVRTYKNRRYILDSGGHHKGARGVSAYLHNNNLYFNLAMSTSEDTLTWTVRTAIFTVRWQRVVLTWDLHKGLSLYVDSQFRGLTKTPETVPLDVAPESGDLVIGRKNIGPEYSPAEFSFGSLAIYTRFLEKKDVEKVFGGKKMPYPGLIREVWKELPGKSVSDLKDDPYYPNNPSVIEIIENFDSPFDIEKDYGSRVKGYFVAPETGNYTFYLSGSSSGELWLSANERQQNLTKLVSLNDPTGHNQWNKYADQISQTVSLEAGKYYYIVALQKGTQSTDSLSAGLRLPSGRFMRPITKEILQWRMPGDSFAGVIREVWQDVSGYKITDLTSNANFPNNPSSIEVLDKFDAPFNVDDNYGSRTRGFLKAPETGYYRFFVAADASGELWLSTDETEKNLKKVVAISGWTDHNEWLKFPEQKSERIHLKKGKYYYLEAYQKADKLGDCISIAMELPSGHFEGPVKRMHLSWRLPDGKTGPGPSTEQEAIPKPVGLYPLNSLYAGKDASGNNENGVLSNVELSTGPNGKSGGAYEFKGLVDSFVEIPNDGKLDTKHSMTMLANIYPTGSGGPIINYKTNGWGVHLWQFESNELFVRFVHRSGLFHKPIGSRVLQLNQWNEVGASYDDATGVAELWHNGKMVKSRNVGLLNLATQYPVRLGARDGDDRRFKGKIACVQIYNKALDEAQIGNLKTCPVKSSSMDYDDASAMSGSGSGSGAWDTPDMDATSVAFSHEAGKYDKDEEADDEIQGTDSLSGNKCDPSPCDNGGKCIKDSQRVDGYRCDCTSDFTGRDCQVSKPDAENPVVKRAKIPRSEKEQTSRNYQKTNTAANIEDQIREEKKEDVLLLFQKIGCYKDESATHDLPTAVTVKSVTQEDCARACALQEKAFSYFGLQDADQCYCGHGYGKFGKADEGLCDKPCQGNKAENCGGKDANMVYFFGLGSNYTVKTFTGDAEGSGTDAKVYITLYGEKGDSGFRKLKEGNFKKGMKDEESLLLPDLGKLKKVKILHDNSGSAPSWFLDKVTVTDENGKVFEFPCKEWLSETQGGGKTERELLLKEQS